MYRVVNWAVMLQLELTSSVAGAQHAPRRSDLVLLARIVAGSASLLLLGMAGLFFARRLTGGLTTPLSGLSMLMAAVVLVSLASLLRAPWVVRRDRHGPVGRDSRAAAVLGLSAPAAALLLLALALTAPSSAIWSVVMLWLIVAGHELTWGAVWWRRGNRHGAWLPQLGIRRRGADASEASPVADTGEPAATAPVDQLPADVTQQIVRSVDAEGVQHIHGALRAQFVAAERTQSLHVAFCPPLSETPTTQCEQIDGPPARLTIAEVQSYGARIDVRLARTADESTSVLLEFHARCGAGKGGSH